MGILEGKNILVTGVTMDTSIAYRVTEIAQAEGEGTLDEWKAEHRGFFARECAALGIEFDPGGDVVVEFVEVLYRRDGA